MLYPGLTDEACILARIVMLYPGLADEACILTRCLPWPQSSSPVVPSLNGGPQRSFYWMSLLNNSYSPCISSQGTTSGVHSRRGAYMY
jgi:hypothetical protein